MCVYAAGYTPAVGVQPQQSSHAQAQAQAVLGTYSPMASHQCSMVQVSTEHPKVSFSPPHTHSHTHTKKLFLQPITNFSCSLQGGVSVSFPQSKVVTTVGGEGGYCCMVSPPSHHSSCHPPSCASLSAPAWSGQYWWCLDGWSNDTEVAAWNSQTHIVNTNTFFSHSLTQGLNWDLSYGGALPGGIQGYAPLQGKFWKITY